MHWKTLFKGDFIAAVEFDGRQPTWTIAEVRTVNMEGEDGRKKDKGTIFFKEQPRGWVLNKTNAICLAAMFGDETSGWVDKRVTLVSEKVKLGAETVDGIRLKGSPDLQAPMKVSVKLPKKRAFDVHLVPTVQRKAGPDAA